MQIFICLILLVGVSPLATTSPQTGNCIVGCKCQEDYNIARKLKINDCDSPLALTKESISNIPKNFTTIALKNVVLKRIEKDAFSGFNELKVVVIQDSNIGSIHPSAFDLKELSTISFTKTTFGEIPNLSSKVLEELIFNDCKLSKVPNVEKLKALTFLNLANNQIKDIDENTFAELEGLEEVTLSNNSITKLPPALFMNNPDFNTLNVDYNPLESFQLNLTSGLEFLSLKSCKLSDFDKNSAVNLNSLSNLDLSGNEISNLRIDTFETMKDLNYIDLSNNKLVELDAFIFLFNSNLDRIILDNNNFELLPNFQTNGKIFATYHFSCKNCGLKSIKDTFENMPYLVSIDLSNNKIDNITQIFKDMPGLKNLNLANNSITSVADAFGKKTELDVLNLSHNPLKPLDPVVFGNIQGIEELNVSNCSLLQLWENHNAILPTLTKLYVGKNDITVISVDDLKVTPSLELFDVQDNPIDCTQELRDFLKYVLDKQIHPIENDYQLKTHEDILSQTKIGEEMLEDSTWKKLARKCDMDSIIREDDDNEDYFPTISIDDDDSENHFYDDADASKDDIYLMMEPKIINERNFSLANASYILSITSVFILTALVVLTIAVSITLLILKRNKNFNMHNGNLPRLKIPLWHTTPGHKKHSGSVYKPLSEDLSGSKTPIINRYEFKQTPQVHSSIP